MSNHLSQDQFAKCFVGRSTSAELRHMMECPECSAELDRFGHTISLFRSAIRDRIDAQVAAQAPGVPQLSIRPAAAGIPKWHWALVAPAVAVLVMVPLLTSNKEPQEVIEKGLAETSPDALMDAVNLHLSRTVPAPMERVMALIPSDESITESGGVQ